MTPTTLPAHGAPSLLKPALSRLGDPWLVMVALGLTALGLVMVFSASSALAAKRFADPAYFLKHQLFHLLVGVIAMVSLALMDYRRWRRLAYPALGLVLVGLVLVLIPGVGHTAGGASRWIRLGGAVSIQPAEFAKLALLIYLAYALSEHEQHIKSFSRGFVPPMVVAVALILPVLAEPDLGMSIMLFALTTIMLFVAGARVSYLAGLAAAASPLVVYLVVSASYRLERLTAFMNPWDDPMGKGYQIIHSFLALASGGFWGAGLDGSMQKLFYLPEPHTDFIFAVLGEELGLWGVLLVLALFMALIWRGVRTALEARDLFGTYLALGATLIIGLQAFTNAAVVMGLLPTKGITLPFISYGGSSLVANFACVGIILSVANRREEAS